MWLEIYWYILCFSGRKVTSWWLTTFLWHMWHPRTPSYHVIRLDCEPYIVVRWNAMSHLPDTTAHLITTKIKTPQASRFWHDVPALTGCVNMAINSVSSLMVDFALFILHNSHKAQHEPSHVNRFYIVPMSVTSIMALLTYRPTLSEDIVTKKNTSCIAVTCNTGK